jgi:hypothetical protein
MSYEPLKRTAPIAKKIVAGIKAGMTLKDIMASIQHLQYAPKSSKALYKYYGQDIADARAEIFTAVGGKVVEQALEGHWESQKFFLQSRAGWSPQSTVNEVEGDQSGDNSSAVDELATLLGIDTDPKDEE